jgi:hypothetical protein
VKRIDLAKPENGRKLTDAITFRLYEDNFSYLQRVSDEDGVPIREFFREFVDEAVQARLNPLADSGAEIVRTLEMVIEQNRLMNERYEELVKKYEQFAEREAKGKQGLVSQLREFGGILSEVLASAIGSRRLVWNYVAFKALKEAKCPESQIRERLDAENKAWNAERDETIDVVKRIIRNKWPA